METTNCELQRELQSDWVAAAAKRTNLTAEATLAVIEAVERAVMDPEHVELDQLLK